MIFYFSSTGNSKYVANRISKAINDNNLYDIEKCLKEGNVNFTIKEGENFGFITPTYCWGLPSIVEEFLSKINIKLASQNCYCFFVTTYGTITGQAGAIANDYMKKKNIQFNALYSVKMPDTWTPIFDLSNKEKVDNINEIAEKQIDAVIENIKNKEKGNFLKNRLSTIIRKPSKIYYEKIRETKHFHVNNNCIGCGLCARNCPVEAIKIENNKPTWIKEKCVMCLKCLHHCPKFAIQYGNKTQKHGQYVHF